MTLVAGLLLDEAYLGKLDEETLAWLLENVGEKERLSLLATGPNMPIESLIKVAHTGSLKERLALTTRKTLDDTVRDILRKDRSTMVAEAAGATPKPKVIKTKPRKTSVVKEETLNGYQDIKSLNLRKWSSVETISKNPEALKGLNEHSLSLLNDLWCTQYARRMELSKHFKAWFNSGNVKPEHVSEAITFILEDIEGDGNYKTYLKALLKYDVYPDDIPKEWFKSTNTSTLTALAGHPKTDEATLIKVIENTEVDDLLILTLARNHPNAGDEVLLAWADTLDELPDESTVPEVRAELIEKLHKRGHVGDYRLLGVIGELSDEEIMSILKGAFTATDDLLAEEILGLSFITSEHLIIAIDSGDYYLARDTYTHDAADLPVRMAYAQKYPDNFGWEHLRKIPKSQRLHLPVRILTRLTQQNEWSTKRLIKEELAGFTQAVTRLRKTHGVKALTMLDAACEQDISANDLINAISDTLGGKVKAASVK